jgi:predicted metal-dependent hydrolase
VATCSENRVNLNAMSTPVDEVVDYLRITTDYLVDIFGSTPYSRGYSHPMPGSSVRSIRRYPQPVQQSQAAQTDTHSNQTPHSEVEVRRSARRRRTVSAYRDGTKIIVQIPAHFSQAEEARWVARMIERIGKAERADGGAKPGARRSDSALMQRCRELSGQYLPGAPMPASVRWVAAMRTRWASCTPVDRSIRVSRRLAEMPGWVLDYVLLHELAHLLAPGHGPEFWALLRDYPRTERARGFLDGVSSAAHLPIADDLADDLSEPPDERPDPDSGSAAGG